jgi:hypothetical protein
MTIPDLKELKKVIELCRKLGVDLIKVDGVEIHLGMAPPIEQAPSLKQTQVQTSYAPGGITEDIKIDIPAELTPEQLLMWSVQDPTELDNTN